MDSTTTVFLIIGLLALGAGGYFLTRPVPGSTLSTTTSLSYGPPTSVPITNGSTAKTLECVGGAVGGAVGGQAIGVPAPVGATLGCALAPSVVKIAGDVSNAARTAAKATGKAAKTAYNDTIGKVVSFF